MAIAGEGVFFGSDKKAQEFRDWMESVGATDEKLPEGSFMDPSLPVNTSVNARLIVIDKPAGDLRFSRQNAPAPVDEFITAKDQSDAKILNDELVRYHGGNEQWRDAFASVELSDAANGVAKVFELAFGARISAVAATRPELANTYAGVRSGAAPGVLFVSFPSENFVAVAGHELYHDLAAKRPDLHQWFIEQATPYIQKFDDYQIRLNSRLFPGESLRSGEATEELLADFAGDALADPEFLQQLADADAGKFLELLNSVKAWLSTRAEY